MEVTNANDDGQHAQELEYRRIGYWVKQLERYLRLSNNSNHDTALLQPLPAASVGTSALKKGFDQLQRHLEVHTSIEKLVSRLAELKRSAILLHQQPPQFTTTSHLPSSPPNTSRWATLEKRLERCWLKSLEKQLEAQNSSVLEERIQVEEEDLAYSLYEPLEKRRRLTKSDTIHGSVMFFDGGTDTPLDTTELPLNASTTTTRSAASRSKVNAGMSRLAWQSALTPSCHGSALQASTDRNSMTVISRKLEYDDDSLRCRLQDQIDLDEHETETVAFSSSVSPVPLRNDADEARESLNDLSVWISVAEGLDQDLAQSASRRFIRRHRCRSAGAPCLPTIAMTAGKARSVPASCTISNATRKKLRLASQHAVRSAPSRGKRGHKKRLDQDGWDDYQANPYSSEVCSEEEAAIARITGFLDDSDYSTSLPVEPIVLPSRSPIPDRLPEDKAPSILYRTEQHNSEGVYVDRPSNASSRFLLGWSMQVEDLLLYCTNLRARLAELQKCRTVAIHAVTHCLDKVVSLLSSGNDLTLHQTKAELARVQQELSLAIEEVVAHAALCRYCVTSLSVLMNDFNCLLRPVPVQQGPVTAIDGSCQMGQFRCKACLPDLVRRQTAAATAEPELGQRKDECGDERKPWRLDSRHLHPPNAPISTFSRSTGTSATQTDCGNLKEIAAKKRAFDWSSSSSSHDEVRKFVLVGMVIVWSSLLFGLYCVEPAPCCSFSTRSQSWWGLVHVLLGSSGDSYTTARPF